MTEREAELQQQIDSLKAELAALQHEVQRRVGVIDDRSMLNAERIVKTHSSMQSMNERLKQVNAMARKAARASGVLKKPDGPAAQRPQEPGQ